MLTSKLQRLDVFKREWLYKAPDGSEIGLGPQKFNPAAVTNGPGGIATATFMPGAATAVLHKTVSEQWFNIDGPDFYIWLCSEDKSIEAGNFYKISAGTKLEIPSGTKFQVYNPSNDPVPVLMITHPFWPQDESALEEAVYPEGPWQCVEPTEFQARPVADDYIDKLYQEDPIALVSSSGYEYVEKALMSINEDVHTYAIAGETWFVFNDNVDYQRMPLPGNSNVVLPLDPEAQQLMQAEVAESEQRILERKTAGLQSARLRFLGGEQAGGAGEEDNPEIPGAPKP